ncbi:uncharacterized protein UV8b_00301 [Ustilaginoidea virens]|uniref:O-methyltransferase n=1 Tax=Ustilaginoidea virens TaxID=1159556 RepID=A0A1B5L1S3_USTVR|nr:uncharacterized protein UV8b_00301 [Ustilaginoidea virens]QUC16060.1 hypothetical protein UV8b_00301 [Ustilaginoidea virens]GAO16341.1 hypothetical protein UVI_02049980 [Ustilaginoidea virens]
MKDGHTNLFDDPSTGDKVTQYADAHSTPLPAHLTEYHAHMCQSRPDAEMLSSVFQSKLHCFLARALGAKRVLEIGVYVGYSLMLWAHAVGPGGFVTGLEYDPRLAELAETAVARQGISNTEIIVGDGAETLPKLRPSAPYDIVFLDADKSGYPNYLSVILANSQPGSTGRLLRPGGLIVADNVLRAGHVADPTRTDRRISDEKVWNRNIEALRQFNDDVARETRLESVMLPLWDGVSLIRLLD